MTLCTQKARRRGDVDLVLVYSTVVKKGVMRYFGALICYLSRHAFLNERKL